MAVLADMWIKKETLKTLLDTVSKKGENGVALTIAINDETNQWGQNLSSYVSQTKEQREAKADRYYTGNGKVFWTDGKITRAEKQEEVSTNASPEVIEEEEDDLPF